MVSRISTISLSIEKENRNASTEEIADFEKAMEICGNGRYQYTFLLVCGVMFLCVGFQYGANAYILPSAECDLHMGSEEKGYLNVAFLMGSVVSALFWGVFAGAYGRRNILLFSFFSDSILTLIGSFSQNFKLFLMFRVISGFLMGGPGSLLYIYLGEFYAEKYRAKSICFIGFFFTLAWLILPGLAWIIIPLPISFEFYGIRYNSWRMFLGAISLPIFIIAMITLMYPESPKFLVSQGKTDEALAIMQKIYAVNTGRDKSEFPVKELLSDAVLELQKDKKSVSSSEILMELTKNIWLQLRTIASPPYIKYGILLWTIYFANMFGFYGFNLWTPELFNRFESYHQLHPNESVTVCELINNKMSLNYTVLEESSVPLKDENTTECKPHMDEQVFINSLIINTVCLFGNIISGYLANRVGRRTMPVVTMFVAGIAGFGLYFVKSSLQILVTGCIFSMMISTGNFVLSSVAVDIFPTHVSAVAVCMMACLGRCGAIASNLAFGMLLDLSCEIPIFLLGGVSIFGGILSFLIPSKEKK
ncbi:synaptic vesicle glycoprotein 2C-like [Nylanderia fulva]|uniref:synaptic vesicle glycoprotein 2C-like n=1 Tax=Nylanderia fulva TaxID=613905 RepID=UPI0010FADFE3|nr:synaptic vesicle glycoprotein 2C-like [Nylanderia fulva]